MENFKLPKHLFEFRTEQNDLDKRIMYEQNSLDHYNPVSGYYRYKLIDKESKKLFKMIKVPKLTNSTYLTGNFAEKYDYVKWPYKKKSLLKMIWWIRLKLRNRKPIIPRIRNSFLYKQILFIMRGVLILIIAYVIWELFKEQIMSLIKG